MTGEPDGAGPPNLWGTPVVVTTKIAAGTGLVANLTEGARLYVREAPRVDVNPPGWRGRICGQPNPDPGRGTPSVGNPQTGRDLQGHRIGRGVKVRVANGTQVADDRGNVYGPGEEITLPAVMANKLLSQGLVTRVRAVRDKRRRQPKGNK